MGSRSRSIRVPEHVAAGIEELADQAGRPFLDVLNQMLDEAVKMWRVPGIVFADETLRREAKVGGTGLGVWEVIDGYLRAGEDWESFKQEFDWLSDFQLRAALAYWRVYSEEIDELIRENQSWTPEKLCTTYPALKPPWVPIPQVTEDLPRT